MKKKDVEKIDRVRLDYTNQYCERCGHTMNFNPKVEKMACSHCGKVNYNKTKSRFMLKMNRMVIDTNKYKVIKLEEDE